MKLPKAVKLPSGSWNVKVMVNGQRISITAPTKREAENEAAAVKAGAKQAIKKTALTVGEAIDRYISSKDAVLSPATIRGYKKIRRNDLQDIMGTNVSALTQEAVQRAVNKMAKESSPKSVRNAHGLLSAALSVSRPDMVLRTTLPQKRPYEIQIPDMGQIKMLLEATAGTDMELPLLLGVWLGLRESEIRGLTWDCIEGDFLHVKQAIVDGENGPVLKGTKTFSGDRKIRIPAHVQALLDQQDRAGEYIVTLSGQAMYKRLSRLCEKLELPHYRFHDLRHTAASVAMSIGVPNTYNQKRMGHKTDNMLKSVYLHTMQSKEVEYADKIDQTFERLLPMKLPTEKNDA